MASFGGVRPRLWALLPAVGGLCVGVGVRFAAGDLWCLCRRVRVCGFGFGVEGEVVDDCLGEAPKGPWPAPQVDRIEPAVAKLAAQFPAWGHRKIWAIGRYDGWDLASPSSVHRAMARRGLL